VRKHHAFLCVLSLVLGANLFREFVQEAAAAAPSDMPSGARLLGQYGTWGAYKASGDGKKVCFVVERGASGER
jgi:hypothetical protein